MQTFEVEIQGLQPLLMNSPAGVDPTNELNKQLKKITSKRGNKKTPSDLEEQDWLEFQLKLYWNGQFVYVPDDAILGAIVAGARANKRGQETLAGVDPVEREIPLIYKGPKAPKALYEAKFVDRRSAGVMKARVMRVRPRFNEWALAFALRVADDLISPDHIKEAIEIAGAYKGLLDFRPRFGRFKLTKWKQVA